jgi:uncharacterized membrane-anchored protein
MSDGLDGTLRAAIAAGLLPADAKLTPGEGRPWPVVLLTALGAWLAAVPLLAVVSILLGDLLTRGAGPYLVGTLVLAAAVVILRSRDLPLFVEQLAVPALLVGIGSLGFGLFDDLPDRAGAACLALISLGLAAIIPRPWLRVLLGAAGAGLCIFALVPERAWDRGAWVVTTWVALHCTLGIWVAACWVQWVLPGRGAGSRIAAALEPVGAGWLLGTLAALALVSGMTLLVGAGLDPMVADAVQALTEGRTPRAGLSWMSAGSVVLTLAAVLWGSRAWSGLRRPWVLGVGLVAAGLAWFLPNLGAVWVALVLTATSRRWRLASAAALAAAWIIGSFYYQLQWPLATKALVLVGAGGLLGALVWFGAGGATGLPRWGTVRRAQGEPGQVGDRGAPSLGRRVASGWPIALTAVTTLGLVNVQIWDKETVIARGQPVFVELAPVDPRSLMQGDYMRLAYRGPRDLAAALGPAGGDRRLVVARRDGRGIATMLRPAQPGEVVADGELLLELIPKGGRWIVASDAWYFKEGDAERWTAARYGEFRVSADGRALLVGMADSDLRRIGR